MNCPSCAHENRPGAKFCEECGAVFKRLCASCSAELRPSAKFCDECGAPVAAAAAPRPAEASGARKVVTIVFADLAGSTALHERLDPESARRFMEGYYAAMRGAVEAHGGTVTQFLGDGVKAVFGIPRVAEDDAIRAVRAAVAMQTAFRALADTQRDAVGRVGLRVAVNTGEVVVSDASEIIGDPVNVAARLQDQGRDGDVVIGEATQRLVGSQVTLEPLGSFALKGRTEAVKAHRLVSLERPAGAAAAPFVGRESELARILSVYQTAASKPATALVVLLGSPGLGKSRLIDEIARRLGDDAALVRAHCDAAGGASLAPVADALRALPDLDAAVSGSDAERSRILEGVRALLAGSPASPEETFFVVRRLLASLAATKPVVLVIDDVHWAGPLLLDLVEHLVQWGSGVPLLVLVGARPELREVRSTLVTPGGVVSEVVTLSGLDAGAAMRHAANVIGADDLPASVAAKVLATSEGNPLFVGELVRMLVHEGALKRDGDRWTAGTELAALEMPPTIHALLAARIERLRPEERTVLERAAVIGRSFSRSAVAELLSRDEGDLDARLESLRRAELVERDTGWFLGEPLLRFHHVLIRDAAYRRILKGTRAELHARFADWIEVRAAGSVEHDETIGWHLEQAHEHLRELGPLDAPGRALGERASQRLAAAGRRALARDDVPLASGLLGRALERLERDDAARAELALDWCEALLAAGDVGPATAALAELERLAGDDARLRAWHTCFAGQLTALSAPQSLNEAAEAVAKAAGELAALGDVAGEAKAHFVHAQAFARLGKVGACEASLDRALAAARRAGDTRRSNTVLAAAPLAALWGPSPVTRASGRCLDVVRVLRITQGAPAVEAVALSCQALLEALRGRTDASRRMIASARKMVEELGIMQRLLEADVFAARIDWLDGDVASAERGLRTAYEGMREMGLGIDAARAGALLARALLAQDRVAEAEALSHESERLAGDDLQAAIAWRGVRAEALAKRGEHGAAVELAKQAVAIASVTDALLDHADARMALAAAQRAAGRSAEADTEERRAIELWEAKGATLLAERARRTGASLEPARAPEPRGAPELRRRVQRNAGSRSADRFAEAIAARDGAALEQRFAESLRIVHHPTAASYGRREMLATWRSALKARRVEFRQELLASLGDALSLHRQVTSVEGLSEAHVAGFGPTEVHEISLIQADDRERFVHVELFAPDHLGAAFARLYERYAELLPEGAARARAAASARSLVALPGEFDLDDWAAVMTPDVEQVDHRILSTWSASGARETLAHHRSMRDVAGDITIRVDDVLAASPDLFLAIWTNSGTDRESGGRYERVFLNLVTFAPDGRVSRFEFFDADREADALARFDALAAGEAPERLSRSRVRPNVARAAMQRFQSAFAARDADVVERLFAEGVAVIDHANGASYGGSKELETVQEMMSAPGTHWSYAPLATLGELLSLDSWLSSGIAFNTGQFDVAAFEVERVDITEVDAQGRFRRSERFAPDHLGDAIARLYQRHAELLPEGAERTSAAATARSLAALLGPPDVERIASAIAPGVETLDHKLLGYPRGSGAKSVLRAIQIQTETAGEIAPRIDDVLALRSHGLLIRRTISGVIRDSGGPYVKELISLYVCGRDGLVSHWEQFDPEREVEALARFDALVAASDTDPAAEPFANAASRADALLMRRFNDRDWAGIEALAAPELVFDERRRMLRNTCGREIWLEQFRLMFDLPVSRFTTTLVATRGERLSLNLHRFAGEVADGGGALEMEGHFALHEVDREGRIIAIVLFDQHDEEAAHAELDARFATGEASACPRVIGALDRARLMKARGWRPTAAGHAPGFVFRDHRLLGWGVEAPDSQSFIRAQQALRELAPDAHVRDDHVRISARGVFRHTTLLGTREGGAFETPILAVAELDEQGRIERFDSYDISDLSRARARFDELTESGAVGDPFANAASRAGAEVNRRFNARDWAGIERLASPDLLYDERRRMARNTCGRDVWLEQLRVLFDVPAGRFSARLLATRGERLSLTLESFEGRVADGGGPLAMDDHLVLLELDRGGSIVRMVLFDQGDLDAAHAELDARYEAGEDRVHAMHATIMRPFARAIGTRNWTPLLALCAPTVVEHDNRGLAVLGTTRGAEAWLANFRVLSELAPDSRYRVDHFRSSARGLCTVGVWHGTREGGPYEIPLVAVLELDEQKRIARGDIYDAEQLDLARARFDELATVTRAPARFENAATRQAERATAAQAARDWQSFGSFFAPEFRNYDRRAMLQLEVDREQFLESYRQIIEITSAPPELDVLATRGDRLAVARLRWQGADGDIGPTEIDYLLVIEVDPRGDGIAGVSFDPGDIDAAYAELDRRFEAGEGAEHPRVLAALLAGRRALEARNWEAFAAQFARGFVCHDHRVLGWATRQGVAEFVRAQQALVELAPDASSRNDHVAILPGGTFQSGLVLGTRDGGAFEIAVLRVTEIDEQGLICRVDIYDPDQLALARARFAELATAARAPARFENAATLVVKRATATQAARDLQAFGALFAAKFRYHDRRAMARVETDREQFLASSRQIIELTSSRPVHEVLATRGDGLALVRMHWEGAEGDIGPSESDWLLVCELDAHGDTTAGVTFDPGDLDAAYAELDARFEAGEGAAHPRALASMLEVRRALAAQDWDAVAAWLAPAFVFHDHRRLGFGVLGAAEFLRLQQTLAELAPDSRSRNEHVATLPRGHFQATLIFGTRDGGAFELAFLRVSEIDAQGKACRVDLYDPDRIDEALARFAELRLANTAAETMLVCWQATFDTGFASGDWQPMRAICAPEMVFDDRRRLALLTGGRELMIASARERAAMGARPVQSVVETFGDRVVVLRLLWSGGPVDGRFEIEYLGVVEVDGQGSVQAIVLLEADDLPAAQREASLRAAAIDGPSRDPLRIPENAAARHLSLRVRARADEATLRSLAADDFCFDDRGRRALVHGGIEEWLSALRFLVRETGAQSQNELVATAGDRLALHRVTWREAPGQPNFQLVHYRLTEIDAAGKLRALVLFDADQRVDAHAELFERYVGTGAVGAPAAAIEYLRAFNAHDLARLREALHGDFVFDDHRRAGAGRLEGADAYVPFVAAGYELTRELRSDVVYVAAAAPHGIVVLSRASGTNLEGGEFESFYVALLSYRGERVVASDFYEPEELERALARFEALSASERAVTG